MKVRGTLGEYGCSNTPVRGEYKETLDICKEFCKDTKFLEAHASGYCGCFKDCDFRKSVSEYVSKADVYEQMNIGMLCSITI